MKILITSGNADNPATRVAITEDGDLTEIFYDSPDRKEILGNIYKGKVDDVLSGLGSAFVKIGEQESLFLSKSEVNDAILRSRGFDPSGNLPSISEIIHEGESLIIQVRREGIGSKNPQGTTKVSLPGRYWVFLPKDQRLGISRRIDDEQKIQWLKDVAHDLKEDNEGLIARTASVTAEQEDLERDFNFLLGTWKGIEDQYQKAPPLTLLRERDTLVRRTLRDRLVDKIDELIIEGDSAFQEALDYLHYLRLDQFEDHVQLYEGNEPLFEAYNIEQQLQESLSREVPLEYGGYLVIDETEALTAIDVNTGSNVSPKLQSQAILKTNLSAARKIPRLLRLRKISGIIVVDFVDMRQKSHQDRVISQLTEVLKQDRVPADFIDMTDLGLVEITRKREGKSLRNSGILKDSNHEE